MKISISKKILGMVILPIVCICLIAGIVTSNITKTIITDEIELQLKAGAYSVSQTLQQRTLIVEMNSDISNLHDYTGMDVTVFQGNVRVASTILDSYNNPIIGTEMDSHIYGDLQSGKDYFATDANVNGVPYFGYYIPFFEENGEFSGAVFTGISQEEANRTILLYTIKIIGCLLGYGLIFVIFALFLVRKMVKRIKKLEKTIGTLLSNDLSVRHEKFSVEHDEIETLCNKTVDYSEQLKNTVENLAGVAKVLNDVSSELNEATEKTATNASEITTAAEEVAKGATAQAKNTEDINTRMFSMAQELDNIKGNTDELQRISESMDSAKDNAVSTLAELQNVNNTMAKDVEATSAQVNITSESVQKIKDAVEMIQNVADQTNLLSLNASIESSKAGENGRGFSVVATEMRNLANQSAEYANNIKNMVSDIEKNYGLIIEIVDNTANNMAVQNEKLSDTQKVFGVLEEDINGAVGRIESIAGMVKSLVKGVEEVVDTIAELSGISQENSASAQESMAQIEEMGAVITQIDEKAKRVFDSAELLMKEVSIFKV